MADEKKTYPSRVNKKNRSTTNSMLNVMIGLVFALILIVGAFIFLGQTDNTENAQEPESVEISTDTDNEASDEVTEEEQQAAGATEEEATNQEDKTADEETSEEDQAEEEQEENTQADEEAATASDDKEEGTETEKEADEAAEEEGTVTGGTITRQESNDPIVKETVINTSWEPVGTKQSGQHVSVYDTNSVDWQEKIKAITYATGLAEEDMYIMYIGNGGGPQKSIGTVQSKDMSKKYRVHLQWVEKEGWKPVKMDILNTVEGAY